MASVYSVSLVNFTLLLFYNQDFHFRSIHAIFANSVIFFLLLSLNISFARSLALSVHLFQSKFMRVERACVRLCQNIVIIIPDTFNLQIGDANTKQCQCRWNIFAGTTEKNNNKMTPNQNAIERRGSEENGKPFTLLWDYVISSIVIISSSSSRIAQKTYLATETPKNSRLHINEKELKKTETNTDKHQPLKEFKNDHKTTEREKDRAGQILCAHREIESSKWNGKKKKRNFTFSVIRLCFHFDNFFPFSIRLIS